jgi:hypothetical protein
MWVVWFSCGDNFPTAEFTFLLACQLTTGDEDLSKEFWHRPWTP